MAVEFTMTRRVAFCETDLAGVMHFSNYLRWMEDVEHAFWRSIGRSVHAVAGPSSGVTWPRVSVTCEYFAPIRFEDEVELTFRVLSVGEKSLQYEVEFRSQARPIARAKATTVCCTMENSAFRSVPIPAEIRTRLIG